ncbi:MAG: DUF3793 family protein [Enterocloster bolteae]
MRTVTDRYEDIKSSHSRTFQRAAVLELFKETAVSCCILYESSEKPHFFFISDRLLKRIWTGRGKGSHGPVWLQGMGFGGVLSLVSIKYEEHMEDCAGFPHEIGLLLGYPAKDVTGFIENNGKNFLYIGYWKVYSDLSECKRIFQSYNHAREHIIHMVSRGMKIDAILRIHNLNQYKSMTR